MSTVRIRILQRSRLRMGYEAWYESAAGKEECKKRLFFFGSGGALPPFPTPTEPTISHPILRMRQFMSPAGGIPTEPY
jgi:hypothetical protein